MTLILQLYLDMVVTYLHAKNEVIRSNGSKVMEMHTDRQMDIQMDRHVKPLPMYDSVI